MHLETSGKRTADEARRVDKDAAVDARNLRQRIVANSAPTVRIPDISDLA
jgi:hypothetical protein